MLTPLFPAIAGANRAADTSRRSMLQMISSVVLILGSSAIFVQLASTEQWYRMIFPAYGMILGFLMLRMMALGRSDLIYKVAVFGCAFLVIASIGVMNGVLAASVGAFGVLILLAGWLIAPVASVALGGLMIVYLLVLAYAMQSGLALPLINPATPIHAATIHIMNLTIAIAIGYFGAASLKNQIKALELKDEQLTQANQALEHRVAERTNELQSINTELNAFSYAIAHDLRAPLRGINGRIHLMLGDPESQIGENERSNLRQIEVSAVHMSDMVKDLLELAHVSHAEMKLVTLNMANLANDVIGLLSTAYPNAVITMEPDLRSATGDAVLLRQIWHNLIGNALKFSSVREQSIVDVGWSDAHNAWFVRDNGVGLDLEKADRVFDTFRRMHSHADFEGTGIGLALVRRAIERHQGKIWIQSKPDQGATFYFALGEQSNVETC